MVSLGFVGVGRMGSMMAPRLIAKGYELTVYDRAKAAVDGLVAGGAKAGASAAAVADVAEVIFLSLPTPDVIKAVALNELANGKKVKTIIDMSTTGPKVAAEVAAALAKKNITYIDAPVSGGIKGAREGTLAIMVAGPKAVFETVKPIMENLGKLFFVGEGAGMAQTVKLGNNMIAASVIILSAEALAMGVKAGVDPKVMIDVLNVSTGRNSATQDKFPRAILPGTFDFGFTTALSYKDVRMCIDEAENLGVPMVMGGVARQYLAACAQKYGPDSDFTNLARLVEDWAGVEIRSKS